MKVADHHKRQHGRFYTEGNPFGHEAFSQWARSARLRTVRVLEPFAGANNIIRALQEHGYAKDFASFDIDPRNAQVWRRDTLSSFPRGFDVCVTNPPWLAKNSAHRRGLWFPDTSFDDLYKFSLDIALAHCPYVAAIIPATYLQSKLFRDRVETVIFLHDEGMFSDTENPVCLALFVPQSAALTIYHDDHRVGSFDELRACLPKPRTRRAITFNHPEGELGFVAFDGTQAPSIKFCKGEELAGYTISHSSRMITRIKTDLQLNDRLITTLNRRLAEFRQQTQDVFLTPFKGLRKDGKYRRRMDYSLARDFIETYA